MQRFIELTAPVGVCVVFALVMNMPVRADDISFSRDVLPILSDRCFHCHGPDEADRQADLRLDISESALDTSRGAAAIVPGRPDASELVKRITTRDPELRMPPADAHRKPLTARETETLREWIAQGAKWGRHWSFVKPSRPTVPSDELLPIDAFVRQRLQREGLSPSVEADPRTLARRVAFDLTGLPPDPILLQKFLADPSDEAYRNLVERLLESPHYGERMAMWWLDAARYSDTDGYQQDATRNNWPWRDWVIQSFNANRPFDEFTIEQFAGDLLPNATAEQRLATCFHRNHMTNGEGGRDPEESRIDYVIDRVNTTGTVWLGLTLGCCQCHSHKFDPVSQHDYYSLFAFFDSIDEDGRAGGGAKPYLKYKSPFAERAVAESRELVASRKQVMDAAHQRAEEDFPSWLKATRKRVANGFVAWQPLDVSLLESVEGTVLAPEPDGVIVARGPNPRQDDYRLYATTSIERITGLRLEVFPHASHTEGKLTRGQSGEFILTDVKLQVRVRGQSQLRDIELSGAVADVERKVSGRNYGKVRDTLDDDPRNGWTTETHDPRQTHVAVFALAEPLRLRESEELVFVMLHRSTEGDANIGRFRVSVTDQPGAAVRALRAMPLEELAQLDGEAAPSEELRKRLLEQFLTDHQVYQTALDDFERANAQLSQFTQAAGELNVMVLAEREQPRVSHVLQRGVWDQKGDKVAPAVPNAILDWPAEQTRTRLDLARWLVSPDNPLTARVIVNQLWQMCFGAGLVRTPDDFGLQGERPTHPELLDWLAVELVENDWDLRHVLRTIVTSRTYRQGSQLTAELLERDPENRLLARASRFRLPSWMIRDAALQASGLLNPAIGGPPVLPYQPPGVWSEMFMGRFRYKPSQGPAQHRRTVYAFWRRSAAPTFLFDSAQRRVCEVRPRRTNTPLQALTLMNDLTLREAARALARQAVGNHDGETQRVAFLVNAILSRKASPRETSILIREYRRALEYYHDTPDAADAVLSFGQAERRGAEQPAEVAAAMLVASLIFNLDEAVTHE